MWKRLWVLCRWALEWMPVILLPAAFVMTVMAFAGRLYWPFDILTHGRPQYLVCSGFLLVICVYKRRWKWSVLAIITLAVNLSVVLPHAWPDAQAAQTEQGRERKPLRVATINVLARNKQYEKLKTVLEQWQPEVVALQECGHLWRLEMLKWKHLYPYQTSEVADGVHHELVILSKKPWRKVERVAFGAAPYAAALAVEIEMEGKTVSILTFHSQKPTRSSQVADVKHMHQQLIKWLEKKRASGQNVIVMGDFNCTPWSIYYRDFIKTTGLQEGSRGRPFMATWSVLWPQRLMIDHVLFSEAWRLNAARLGTGFGSDHRPVIVDLGWRS